MQRDEEKRKSFKQDLEKIDPVSIVYVDESGFDAPLIREYGYSPKGQRLMGERSGQRFARTSIIAGLQETQPIAPMIFRGHCHTEVVLAWVKEMLLPNLKAGMTVIWDNATFHKSPKIVALFQKAGVGLLFLPPYSPDLSPIEQFGARLKAHIRQLNDPSLHISQALTKVFSYL